MAGPYQRQESRLFAVENNDHHLTINMSSDIKCASEHVLYRIGWDIRKK